MTSSEKAVLDAVLSGDIGAMQKLRSWSSHDLNDLAAASEYELPARAVVRVLEEYDAGMWPQADVQEWAQLMRWGVLFGPDRSPFPEFVVEYAPDAEDAIIEALARLDELGDIIDGELRPGEAAELCAALMAATHAGT